MKQTAIKKAYRLPDSYLKIELCELMAQAPHVLIAGATGSGKSVLIEDFLYFLTATHTPHDLHLILCDPKKVSFTEWAQTPFCERWATEPRDILNTLGAVVSTMNARYNKMMAEHIKDYKGRAIWVVIDEIADFMTADEYKKEFITLVQRIAQLGRASNIHLLMASQSPARAVIPAKLLINVLGRVGLQCDSKIESKQIIGVEGCEQLPQHGRALYKHVNRQIYPAEIPFIPDRIQAHIDFWLKQGTADDIPKPKRKKNRLNYGLLDALRGNKLVRVDLNLNDLETLETLSIIDDD